MQDLQDLLVFLLFSLVMVAAGSIAGFILLRSIFVRAADRMAHEIDRALGRFAGAGFSRLAAYAATQGVPEEVARAQFYQSIGRTARVMDSLIRLPVVGGIGLDSLLGVFPVAGDMVSAAVSVRLIAKSLRYGVPPEIISRMLANVLLDLLLGVIPVAGDLADMWFKANERNVELLKEYLGGETTSRT